MSNEQTHGKLAATSDAPAHFVRAIVFALFIKYTIFSYTLRVGEYSILKYSLHKSFQYFTFHFMFFFPFAAEGGEKAMATK